MKTSNLSSGLRLAGLMSVLGLSAVLAPRSFGFDVSVNINAEPPPPRHEVVVERNRPGPDYVWVNGYWGGSPGHYVWTSGHWDRPPRHGAVWVEPRWEMHGHDRVFVKGYWR